MKDTWRAGLKSLEVERNVANLHHYAEHSRHHTKDKQRFVVSVVAYDSLPGHQRSHRRSARVGLHQGGRAPANFEMDRSPGLTRGATTAQSMSSRSLGHAALAALAESAFASCSTASR